MARVFANDKADAATADKLALVANAFNAGTNFHDALFRLTTESKAQQYTTNS